jgi:hypothetical protein
MVTRQVFVEGGGEGHDLKTECRRAFTQLLQRAGCGGRMPRIVACGPRTAALDAFVDALASTEAKDHLFLLIDAEGPVVGADPWAHVARRQKDGWTRPEGALPGHLHLMVQTTEAWLLADVDGLQGHFGRRFERPALPAGRSIESLSKPELDGLLARAFRELGGYQKGRHCFPPLAALDPARIRAASPWAERFFTVLAAGLSAAQAPAVAPRSPV